MMRVEFAFLGVFVAAYAMSKCPWLDGSTTPYALVIMGILVLVMMAQRMKFYALGFVPRIEMEKAAIFIAGADQPMGWMSAILNESREAKVYASVEDLDAPSSEWIRSHLSRHTTLVKMVPGNQEDAEAAARLVAETIGDHVLTAVVYTGYAVPKISDSMDMDDVQRGTEINALAPVYLAKAFAPLLQKHNGRFVLVADMAGRVVIPSLLSYCSTQAIALQYGNIIRKMLEKYNVSTHVVEPMLYNFRKSQEMYYYPGSCPETGKVLLEVEANHLENRIILIERNILRACMEKKSKKRYLTTFEESFIDLIIWLTPSCIYNRLMTFYLNYFLVKRSP